MASIWKHPQSQYFTACWTDATGRRLKRSTKTTDKKLAEKMARQFEEESRVRRTAKQARQVLSDIYRSISGDELPSMTVRQFFTDFIERKRPEVGKASLDYYNGHARRFFAWLGVRADGDIAEITKTDITKYRNHAASISGPTSTNNTLRAIKAFFSAARKDSYVVEDPAADVDTVRDRTESSRRPFTLDELRAVLAVADDEWKSLIRFGLFTGQRLGDVATLTRGNLTRAGDGLKFTARKTGRKQEMPLAPALRAHVAALPANTDPRAPIHPRAAATVLSTKRTSALSKEFVGLLRAAGLRKTIAKDEGHARARHELSFHSLRHTATSLLKEAGIPQSVVMDFIGHDSADTSAGYTHTGKEALEKAAAAFPEL